MSNTDTLILIIFGMVLGMLLLAGLLYVFPGNIFDSRGVCTGQGLEYVDSERGKVSCREPVEPVCIDTHNIVFDNVSGEWIKGECE